MTAADPLARDTSERSAYERDMRELLVLRLIAAWGLFITVRAVAGVVVTIYFPERLSGNLVLLGGLLAVAGLNVFCVRRAPRWTITATVLSSIAGVGVHVIYFVLESRIAESTVIIFMLFLTGLLILFPWGWRGQAWVGAAAVVGHLLVLRGGVPTALPLPLGILAIMVAATFTVVGAHLLDKHRFEVYRHTRAAERANSAKSEFLATVSHELRTPLSVIMGYTDLLLEESANAEQQDMLRRVRQQSAELLDLIQAMLHLDRMETGRLHGAREEFRVGELFDRLRADIPPGWCKPGVRLEWPESALQTVMRSERRELEIILRNLIHNALKYTEQGSVRVEVAVREATRRIQFTVGDNGPGIPAEDLAIIFDMFAQGGSNGPRGGGVGLGLFIVKRLVDALGGTVEVHSEAGAGARFTVSLPLYSREGAALVAG
jgi:signal transduction histidine kinase